MKKNISRGQFMVALATNKISEDFETVAMKKLDLEFLNHKGSGCSSGIDTCLYHNVTNSDEHDKLNVISDINLNQKKDYVELTPVINYSEDDLLTKQTGFETSLPHDFEKRQYSNKGTSQNQYLHTDKNRESPSQFSSSPTEYELEKSPKIIVLQNELITSGYESSESNYEASEYEVSESEYEVQEKSSTDFISSSSDEEEDKKDNFTLLHTTHSSLEMEEELSRKSDSFPKKDLCTFCYEEVDHFSRHLLKKHIDEEAVRKISTMPVNSIQRRKAIIGIRRRGNFILKNQKDCLKPVRRPSKKHDNSDYVPCANCLGFFKSKYLWRHNKTCAANVRNSFTGTRRQHLSESQTLLACTGYLGNYLNKTRLSNDVFKIMRPDKISFVAKNDVLICLYGESYLGKHKRKQMNIVVSNKMREMARLKIAIQESTTVTQMYDLLKAELYPNIVAATKIISGYDPENHSFQAGSLALHMGTNLKFLCDVAKKAVITRNPLIPIRDKDKTIKEISELRDMLVSHWCNDISSLANKVLTQKSTEKPKLLPLTEDILIFNNYVRKLADEAYNKLKSNQEIGKYYKILTECTLAIVLIFNRKRVGEVQFLEIETYQNIVSLTRQEECIHSLTEFEKNMSESFKRVVTLGKGSRPVPLLFSKGMQKYIELLLLIRRTHDIVPKSNKYIFANTGSSDRWMCGSSVLRRYAHNCGAKNPELLTSTRFRKQIATILQIMSIETEEMEQIARFMGHSEKSHKEFYRLTEDVYQTAKVAKVLLLLNAGKGSEFKGKSLSEIQINDETLEIDEQEQDNPVEHKTTENLKETMLNMKDDEENIPLSKIMNAHPNLTKQVKSGGRKRWLSNEKKMVLNHFRANIRNKIAPKKQEVLNFIKKHSGNFKETDWVRIKTLVYNCYRDK